MDRFFILSNLNSDRAAIRVAELANRLADRRVCSLEQPGAQVG
jgi:hypothetical protein